MQNCFFNIFLSKIVGHRKFGKDAILNFNLPVRVLLNASKTLVKGKKEKEVKNDLLSCVAPLTDERCSFSLI